VALCLTTHGSARRAGPLMWQICTTDLIGAEAHRPAAVNSPTLNSWGRIGKVTSRGGSDYNHRPRHQLTVWQSNATRTLRVQSKASPVVEAFGVCSASKGGLARSGSMAAAKPQGQALRVLAHSQPCPFSPATLHLQVAKAKGALPPAGLRLKRLI
jgi:hypothetical protein